MYALEYLQEIPKFEKVITRKTAPFIKIVLNQLASNKFMHV